MIKNKVVILGYGSQLSLCLNKTNTKNFICYNFKRRELDINNKKKLFSVLQKIKPNFIINTAALTDVNFCEKNSDLCFSTNAESVKNIAYYAKKINSCLVHFSSDFVYDGLNTKKYTETDTPRPISIYGKSKLLSEKYIINNSKKFIILRISSLYSNYGKNFYKYIIQQLNSSNSIQIFNYQKSNPTNAMDLSKDIWSILEYQIKVKERYGIYNYSSFGKPLNRYEFSKIILKLMKKYQKISCKIIPTKADHNYKLIRPKFSALNINKVAKSFNLKKINHSLSIKRSIKEYYLEHKHLKL